MLIYKITSDITTVHDPFNDISNDVVEPRQLDIFGMFVCAKGTFR